MTRSAPIVGRSEPPPGVWSNVNAGGIVPDLGGLLSHGSVVAREYGVPAVVSAGTTTHDIRTGQMLRVDGSLGEVRLL